MQKFILYLSVVSLMIMTNIAVNAQETEQKKESKTTTLDSWRDALPATEQPSYIPPSKPIDSLNNDEESAETPAEVEAKILDLESKWIEAVKQRDPQTLKNILSDNFMIAGIEIPGAQTDKARYIEWTQKNLSLKSYERPSQPVVKSFAATAVVSYKYTRQASIDGAPSNGEYSVTDVWIKSDNRWQVVSHHISKVPKVAVNPKQ